MNKHTHIRHTVIMTVLMCAILLLSSVLAETSWADSPAAQRGTQQYATVTEALNAVDRNNKTITLLRDVSENVALANPNAGYTLTLDLAGHTISAVSGPAVTISNSRALRITGEGEVRGRSWAALNIEDGTIHTYQGKFTSDTTLLNVSGEGNIWLNTGEYIAPKLVEETTQGELAIQDAGVFRCSIPSGIEYLDVIAPDALFSDVSNLLGYLQDDIGYVQQEDGLYRSVTLQFVIDKPTVEIPVTADTKLLTLDELLTLTGTRLNGTSENKIHAKPGQLEKVNEQITAAVEAAKNRQEFSSDMMEVRLTVFRDRSRLQNQEYEERGGKLDELEGTVNVTVKAVVEQEELHEMPNTGDSTLLILASLALILLVAAIGLIAVSHHSKIQ